MNCPNCLKPLSAHEAVRGAQVTPKPGDVSICGFCATLLKVVTDPAANSWTLQAMTAKEIYVFKIEQPEAFHFMAKLQDDIKKLIKEYNRKNPPA